MYTTVTKIGLWEFVVNFKLRVTIGIGDIVADLKLVILLFIMIMDYVHISITLLSRMILLQTISITVNQCVWQRTYRKTLRWATWKQENREFFNIENTVILLIVFVCF